MVSVDEAVIARLHRGSQTFEILVDSEKALAFKKGKPFSIENILAVREVFKDVKKGERAAAKDLQAVFQTADIYRVSVEIIRHGELQLTTEQRRKMTEEKRKQIVHLISRQAVNPQTKLPHPPQRIENAMEQARVNIDPFKSAEEQMHPILEAIRPILPISMETLEIALKVPAAHAGKISGLARTIGPVKSEEWKADAWYALMEIPAGLQAEIYSRLNDLTGGTVEVKVVKRMQA